MTKMDRITAPSEAMPVDLPDAFAGLSESFARAQLDALENALIFHDEVDEVALTRTLAVIASVAPGDEMQALIAAQMALTHGLALEWYALARQTINDRLRERTTNLVVKLMRTCATQAQTLARLRKAAAPAPTRAGDENRDQPHAKGRADENPHQPHAKGAEERRSRRRSPGTGAPDATPDRAALEAARRRAGEIAEAALRQNDDQPHAKAAAGDADGLAAVARPSGETSPPGPAERAPRRRRSPACGSMPS